MLYLCSQQLEWSTHCHVNVIVLICDVMNNIAKKSQAQQKRNRLKKQDNFFFVRHVLTELLLSSVVII